VNRRELIKGTFAAAAATQLSAQSTEQVPGANDRIRIGVIGLGVRAQRLMDYLLVRKDTPITAVCDVWQKRVDAAKSKVGGATGFIDYRKLLDSKLVDAVFIATPDHWHAPMSIDSMNAGKDVYVEKPLTWKMEEGPEVVKAARVNGRICQVGAQQRSGPHYIEAMERFVESGKLGQVGMVRIERFGIHGGHPAPGKAIPPGIETKPSDLDWNLYLGRVKYRDWDPEIFFDFRKFFDFGGAQFTDKLVHDLDSAHMFMKQDDPIAAATLGGIYHAKERRDAPDICNTMIEYRGKWMLTYYDAFARNLSFELGMELIGTDGRLTVTRKEYAFYSSDRDEPPVIGKSPRDQTIDHIDNFVACCRSRKRPNGDVYFGHRSAQVVHLATQAYIQRRRLRFDPDLEVILPS